MDKDVKIMTIEYNVSGSERKRLVTAIAEFLNLPAEYKGMPTAAYAVGDYIIDKVGTVNGPVNYDLVADLQRLHNFNAVNKNHVIPVPEPELVMGSRDWTGEPGEEYKLGHDFAIEIPLDGFTEVMFENLEKLIVSKAALIKKAIGADDLRVERTETTIRFPWLSADRPVDEIDAYSRFISALCSAAKDCKRVIAKERLVDNEKFAFRVFLVRLGFVGDEFKTARKVLMRNLSGNSAYRNRMPQAAGN